MTVFFGLVCAGIALFIFLSLIVNAIRDRKVKNVKVATRNSRNNSNNIQLTDNSPVENKIFDEDTNKDSEFVNKDELKETTELGKDSTDNNDHKNSKSNENDLFSYNTAGKDESLFQNDLKSAIEFENLREHGKSDSNNENSEYDFYSIEKQAGLSNEWQLKKKPVHFGEDLVTLFVLPGYSQKFEGYELYQTLVDEGLIFGDMSIFHYFIEDKNSEARHAFSVANATEQGTFDLDSFGSKAYYGICLVMNLEISNEAEENFEIMLEKSHNIARALNGVVCDEFKNPLKNKDLEVYYKDTFNKVFSN
ncbi:MAG: cell division protein ZipA C-terminal FtsZ-binding domain-containing protein [Legionellales bacterium]|nr:cell division protein ZipA C-terminal FtsZ-binding domain-containing protein [Legionellales bacterium]